MKYRKRLLEKKLLEMSKFFKVVLVVGARQVGKSTLLKHVFPDLKVFVFDPLKDNYGAKSDPDLFLDSHNGPIILDEIQYAPQLLPALKRRVDMNEAPGQYFLTGSQNLTMLKGIAESLAGRVGILQLEGFTIYEEQEENVLYCWLENYLNSSNQFFATLKNKLFSKKNLVSHLWHGSMPGLLDAPDSMVPTYFSSYINTYLERDVRLFENVKDLSLFHKFVSICGALTSQEINSSHFAREIGVTPATARKWLDMLIQSYQWLEIDPYFGNTIKRISGKKKGYLRDSGLACNLQKISSPDALAVSPHLGSFFETFVVNQLYRYALTMNVAPNFYHWRTGGGAEVDIVLERDGKLFPIEIKCKSVIAKRDLRGIKAFRETYPKNDISEALVIYAGKESYKTEKDITVIPWNLIS